MDGRRRFQFGLGYEACRPSLPSAVNTVSSKDMVINKMAEPQFEEAPTKVFWAMDDMPVPKGVNPAEIVPNIRSTLWRFNYRGPISISAYCRWAIPPSQRKALSSDGVVFSDVLLDRENDLLGYELLVWARKQPSPANIMLVVRYWEEGFGHQLIGYQTRGYNVLVAHTTNPFGFDCVKTRFLWSDLAKGVIQPDSGFVAGEATLEELVVATGQATLEDQDVATGTLEELVVATGQVTLEDQDVAMSSD